MPRPKPVKLGHHVLYRCGSQDHQARDIILRGPAKPPKEVVYRPALVLHVCQRNEHDEPISPPRVNLRVYRDGDHHGDSYRPHVPHHETTLDETLPAWIDPDELDTRAHD